jgi:hypothetical protein
MDRYDQLYDQFSKLTKAEKLAILRVEITRLLTGVKGYSHLINLYVEERGAPQMPDGFSTWCQKLVEEVNELTDFLDALTAIQHRRISQEQSEQRRLDLGQSFWLRAQASLPELLPHANFEAAIRTVAQQCQLPLAQDLDGSLTRVDFQGFLIEYQSGKEGPRARCGPQGVQQGAHFLGYVVALQQLVDLRNYTWREHEGLTESLESAVTVLSRWLVEGWSLEKICEAHEWMRDGRVDRTR